MSDDNDNGSGGDYEVGYGRPPKATRFKSGQSGNPKGRPKDARSLSTLVRKELDRKQEVTLGGRRQKIAKRHVMVKQQADKAMKGDLKSFMLLARMDEMGGGGSGGSGATDDADTHEISDERIDEIMQAYVLRVLDRPSA